MLYLSKEIEKGVIKTDYSSIVQAIGTLGFPILACIACFAWMRDYQKKTDERIDKINEKVTDALNNNTLALTQLSERLVKNESID